jgi:hypothetical protein
MQFHNTEPRLLLHRKVEKSHTNAKEEKARIFA